MGAKELKIGAKCPCWAPVTTQGAGVLPTYGTGVVASKLSKVVETINLAEGQAYFDDDLDEEVSEFRSIGLAVDTKGYEDTVLEAMYGSVVTDGVLEDGVTDAPPLGGFAFYQTLVEAGVYSYRAYHYPLVRAKLTGDTMDTKGASINIAGTTTNFKGYKCNSGKWRRRKRFATEADAELWAKNAVSVAVAYEVYIAVSGTGTVTPNGLKMVATGDDLDITIGGTCSQLYDNGVDVKASIAGGVYTLTNVIAAHKIVVVYTPD